MFSGINTTFILNGSVLNKTNLCRKASVCFLFHFVFILLQHYCSELIEWWNDKFCWVNTIYWYILIIIFVPVFMTILSLFEIIIAGNMFYFPCKNFNYSQWLYTNRQNERNIVRKSWWAIIDRNYTVKWISIGNG